MMTLIIPRIALLAQFIGFIYATQNDNFDVKATANPSTVSAQERDINFTCEYTGISPPDDQLGQLRWIFRTKEIYIYKSTERKEIIDYKYQNRLTTKKLDNKTMIFRLSNAGLCDAGKYTCQVYAESPRVEADSITVTKEDISMDLQIHLGGIGEDTCESCKDEKRVVTLRAGETSNLRCVALHTPSPGPALKWITVPPYKGIQSLYPYADDDRCVYGKVNELRIQLSPNMNGRVLFMCVADFAGGREFESEYIEIIESREDIDDCDPNPCLNDGSCTDEVDSYICTCAEGYTGTICETDIDDCDPNPCLNDGSCTDEVDSYICTCAEGNTGTNCETESVTFEIGIILGIVAFVLVTIVVVGLTIHVVRWFGQWRNGSRDSTNTRNRRFENFCCINMNCVQGQTEEESMPMEQRVTEQVVDAGVDKVETRPSFGKHLPENKIVSSQSQQSLGDNVTYAGCQLEEVDIEKMKYLLDICKVQVDAQDDDGHTALHRAVQTCRPDVVKILLEIKNVMEVVGVNGQTALHMASSCELPGFREIVKILIDNGCEVDVLDENGQTALHLAASNGAPGSADVMKMLLEKNCEVDAKDSISGETAFHIAAKSGSIEAVKMLLEFGCQLDLENNNGKSAMELAKSNESKEVFEYLNNYDNTAYRA